MLFKLLFIGNRLAVNSHGDCDNKHNDENADTYAYSLDVGTK